MGDRQALAFLWISTRRVVRFLERHVGSVNCFRVEQSSAQYREFAEECRRLAQLAQTAEERKVLQEMEAAWTKLAGEVERKAAQGSG
jgi:cell shape-determining protein MreC